jgi:hypothetical protein
LATPRRLESSRRYRCSDESAGAKSTNRNSRNKTALIRKPFYQHGYRHNVTKPETQTADKPVAKIKPPHFVGGIAGQKNAQAIERSVL